MTVFFETRLRFRAWLKSNAQYTRTIKIGFRARPNGHACMTIDEARAEAIRFGWCEGRRMAIDAQTFASTFGPRKPNAKWRLTDIALAGELIANGDMTAEGHAVFQSRMNRQATDDDASTALSPIMLAELKRHTAAWSLFQRMPPSHRTKWTEWVMGAKQEKTRSDRFARLMMDLSRTRK